MVALAVGTAVVFAAGAFSAGNRSPNPGPPLSTSAQPWLGLRTTTSPARPGALVTQVVSGGPAAQAGLQQGDVVTAVNGQQTGGPSDIAAAVDPQLVGNEVLIQIDRGGQLQTVGVTLAKRPAGAP
jgi:S1-C subfamily serine protease